MRIENLSLPLFAAAIFVAPVSSQCQSSCETSESSVKSMQEDGPSKNIVEVAASTGKFNTLLAAAKAAGLADVLSNKGPFTVFAPTDDAFAKLPKGTVEKLLAHPKKLAKILSYHVVPGKVLSTNLKPEMFAGTVAGQSLWIRASKKGVHVDNAKVVKADIQAKNGVIHVIDSVVMPRKDIVATAVAAGSFKTLTAALKAAGLVKALQGKGPFTVFAPTDAAFAKLPKGTVKALLKDIPRLQSILTYHVLSGRTTSSMIPMPRKKQNSASIKAKTLQGQKLHVERTRKSVHINGATVVMKDIITSNGVIHVIDEVLLPKAKTEARGY